ncbi:DUF3871 family protein [Aestuariibaculum suncheonense]|uniref:DUF3871 family protein n=1 Tax=Aestuariibaculum suncheonense TaxID=1028745 RepID=A0A8J6UJ33_9FLAO|nr:DUF3871 family protein [Aestuariibaculum suncheonense]MBD0834466.1 DUF3871 family protein [Aestuariibaculum suncheonense]
MELKAITEQVVNNHEVVESSMSTNNRFIEANTQQVSLSHLKEECIIPVFRDNETTIAHFEFIEAVRSVAQELYPEGTVTMPNIRTSHIIKGRIPSAIGKPAKDLLEHEKTIYYERMAFMVEIPHVHTYINNQKLNLTVGGVRSYSEQNLFSKKSIEKFKVFIGFKNMVCCNLCIATDGLKDDLRVSSIDELKLKAQELFLSYNQERQIESMKHMQEYTINQDQFAHLVGKMKLYQHLDKQQKQELFHLKTTDSQINTIIKNYVDDEHFSADADGYINLWQLYNLFTESAKSNYIDNFLDRNCNTYEFVNHLGEAIRRKEDNYFINYPEIIH